MSLDWDIDGENASLVAPVPGTHDVWQIYRRRRKWVLEYLEECGDVMVSGETLEYKTLPEAIARAEQA